MIQRPQTRYPPFNWCVTLPFFPLFNRWLIERIRSFRCGTHACLRPSSVPFINGEKRRGFRNYSLRTVSARCNNECLSHIRGKKQSSGRREGRRVLWDGEDEDKEKEEYDSSAFCRPLQEESMSAYRKTWWIARSTRNASDFSPPRFVSPDRIIKVRVASQIGRAGFFSLL